MWLGWREAERHKRQRGTEAERQRDMQRSRQISRHKRHAEMRAKYLGESLAVLGGHFCNSCPEVPATFPLGIWSAFLLACLPASLCVCVCALLASFPASLPLFCSSLSASWPACLPLPRCSACLSSCFILLACLPGRGAVREGSRDAGKEAGRATRQRQRGRPEGRPEGRPCLLLCLFIPLPLCLPLFLPLCLSLPWLSAGFPAFIFASASLLCMPLFLTSCHPLCLPLACLSACLSACRFAPVPAVCLPACPPVFLPLLASACGCLCLRSCGAAVFSSAFGALFVEGGRRPVSSGPAAGAPRRRTRAPHCAASPSPP